MKGWIQMGNAIEWKNHGDVNPIEHGGIFVHQENDTTFRIIKLFFVDDEEKNVLWDMYVDISDDWINKESVMGFSGLEYNVIDYNLKLAIDCTSYYSPDNFGCHENIYLTLEESAKYLSEHYGIEVE